MRRAPFLLLAAIVLLADQFTKYWIVHSLETDSSRELIPRVLYFTRTTNSGAAFGVFPHATYLLALTALIAALGIGIYAWRQYWPLPWSCGMGLALPLGGALGNFIDRVRLGYVIDFIEVHIGNYVWPIFNVADSCICIGVGTLVALAVKSQSQTTERQKEVGSIPS